MNERNPPEFRSYRRALTTIYIAVLALGSLLVLASIVVELFFQPREHAPEPSPADLLQCNRDVRGLLEDLGRTAAKLQEEAVDGEPGVIEARWKDFARDWATRWNRVNESCQFDTLAHTGLGNAYDEMAEVHRQLPALQLEYRDMMKRFADGQAVELEDMRRKLDRSRKILEESSETPPPLDGAPARD